VRSFDTGIVVTVNSGKGGVLAKVAAALAAAEVDITQVNMADESPQGAIDMKFIITVRDVHQLDHALRNLRHTSVVLKAQRSKNYN
jgi:GTP pyrophosphokinase